MEFKDLKHGDIVESGKCRYKVKCGYNKKYNIGIADGSYKSLINLDTKIETILNWSNYRGILKSLRKIDERKQLVTSRGDKNVL